MRSKHMEIPKVKYEKKDLSGDRENYPTFWKSHRSRIEHILKDPEKTNIEKASLIADLKWSYLIKLEQRPTGPRFFLHSTGFKEKLEEVPEQEKVRLFIERLKSVLSKGLLSRTLARKIGVILEEFTDEPPSKENLVWTIGDESVKGDSRTQGMDFIIDPNAISLQERYIVSKPAGPQDIGEFGTEKFRISQRNVLGFEVGLLSRDGQELLLLELQKFFEENPEYATPFIKRENGKIVRIPLDRPDRLTPHD